MLQKCVFNRWWVTAAYRPCLIFLSSLCSHPPLSLTIQVDLTLRWSRCSATWNLRWFALRIRSPPPQSFIIQWIPGALWTQWSTSFLSALSESLSVVAPQTAAKQHAPQHCSTAALLSCRIRTIHLVSWFCHQSTSEQRLAGWRKRSRLNTDQTEPN